jgi:alpha-ribazole phosphatase
MKIVLVRHGITSYNEQRKYTGHTDVSLSKKGIKSLHEMKHIVQAYDGLDIITSALRRTKETASILFPASKIVDSFSNLNEINFGTFEGSTYQVLKDTKDYQSWINNICSVSCPEGENFEQFKKRVLTTFVEIINTITNDTIIVAHGGTIQMIMSCLVDNTIDFFNWKVKNGKGFVLELNDNTIMNYTKI